VAAEPGAYVPSLPERALVLLLNLPVSWLAVLFWRVPVEDALTVSALLLDLVLQVCTAVVFPVALGFVLVAPKSLARVGSVVCAVVSVLLGGSVALAALRSQANLVPTLVACGSLLCGIVVLIWALHRPLLSTKWQVSLLAAPLALVPALQFWHGTSFVPSHLRTSVGITAKASVQRHLGRELDGVVDVKFQNNGEVGALVLASEITMCFTDSLAVVRNDLDTIEKLYDQQDKACRTEQAFDHFTVIDGKTTWVYHSAFTTTTDKPLLLLEAHLWYARNDRLRIDPEYVVEVTRSDHPGLSQWSVNACRGYVTIFRMRDEAKFKGVVQRRRLVVYDDQGDFGDAYFNLTTPGRALCENTEMSPAASSSSSADDKLRLRIAADVGASDVSTRQTDWLAPAK
jgi:hypothetical protein